MATGASSLVAVARIIKPRGILGEVVLESLSDVEGRFEKTPAFMLVDQGKVLRELPVESCRFISGRYVLKFRDIRSLTEAESLRGKELAIPEEDLGLLPEGHFFIHHLVGMSVRLRDGREIGKIKNVMKTGGVDILEVGEKSEILIPFVGEICLEVDLNNKQIIIDPPEGLLQLNAR